MNLISVGGWWDHWRWKSWGYWEESSWNDWVCISKPLDSKWHLQVRNFRIQYFLFSTAKELWSESLTRSFPKSQRIYRQTSSEEDEIKAYLNLLHSKGLIKEMDNNAFTRVVQNERSVKVWLPPTYGGKNFSVSILCSLTHSKSHVSFLTLDCETNANDRKAEATNDCHYYCSVLRETGCGCYDWGPRNICAIHHRW